MHKPTPRSFPPLRERLWSRVERSGECWVYVGARHGFGYGLLKQGRRARRAHRVAYEDVVGPIPVGMYVLHRCDNPACVRPSHLFLGTHTDNMRDMVAKGRANNKWHYATEPLSEDERVGVGGGLPG